MKRNTLRLFVWIVATTMLCAGVEAKSRKGDKLLAEGQAAEAKGDWDKALEVYQRAVDESPQDASYIIAMRKARFQAGQMHVDRGQKLREAGKLAEALGEFQQAFLADPSSAIAIQEIKRTQSILKEPAKKPEDAGLTPYERYRKEQNGVLDSLEGPPTLKPVLRTVGPFTMNNQPPRILFDTVASMAGISVVWDSQFTPQARNYNAKIPVGPVEQALDYLAQQTRTYWKPINATTIFITEDSVTKRRDYEDEVMKVIYLTNATSTQEFQEISQAIRTVLQLRQVFTYNAQKALVVRGSLDSVLLAEKLARDLDRPKSEVVVDVMVMEANSSRTRNLAASLATAGTSGINTSIAYTPGTAASTSTTGTTTTTTSTSTAVALSRLGSISTNQFSTTLPGAVLQAMLTDSKTKVMNKPQVRASDGQKVTLQIGDRVPYATGSFQPGVGTVGVSPLVSTQFQYVETGVTLDITPQVHSADEVTLHVEVNVSAVRSYVNLGGLSQPVIGQRKSTAEIRLREGEPSLLGGLSQATDSTAVNGIPGLVNIPILGRLLFGSENNEKDRGELMIALVPHIVRTPDYQPDNVRPIFSGQESVYKVNYMTPKAEGEADEPKIAVPASPQAGAPLVGAPGGASPVAASPSGGPTPGGALTPLPNGVLPSMPSLGLGGQPAPGVPTFQPLGAAAGGQPAVGFLPGAMQIPPGTNFPLAINLNVSNDAVSITPLRIKWDPAVLQLLDMNPGDLLSRDGGRVTTVKDIRAEAGEATLTVTRIPGLPGVSGPGGVAALNFRSIAPGSTTVSVIEMGLKNSRQENIPVVLGGAQVTVQP